ncbi:MAG: cell wall hydrolase [Oscillospiraceae bacterium]|nr:cell wall hydrolase [Oscillospiraceae bacterium]MDE7171907.1 cell wall hydrolase [Oscillospiraceae bacterium]
MKKRAASFLLAILTVLSLTLPALAAVPEEILDEVSAEAVVESPEPEEIYSTILLDGESVPTMEYEMRDGVCYVTVSSFVSALDAEAMVEEGDGAVSVNASAVTQVVEVDTDSDGIEDAANVLTADLALLAVAGASYFTANGRYLYASGGTILLNGRVAAPVRLLAQVFNLTVDYDAVTGQVLLAHQEGAEPYLVSGQDMYDSETVMWLARIIHAESGNQSLEGKIAVGNVVMNRVNNPQFPNTLYDVLFQKNQFSPASSGSIYKEPNWESKVAAMLVLEGVQVVPDALFFNAAGARSYAYKHRTYVTTIGAHDFYR